MTCLRQHEITLAGQTARGVSIRLRPMTELDWPMLLRWNNDPEVLYYSEGEHITSYTLDEVQELYRTVSEHAFCFVIEAGDRPVGEGWLQEMNLERIQRRYPDRDSRRIDLMIGEKDWWGQGVGSEAIRLLTGFGFLQQGADLIWGCDIGDYNPRSRKAFQRAGYQVVGETVQKPGSKAERTYDLMITRDEFLALYEEGAGPS